MSFYQKRSFVRIKGLSEIRRLPRLGKVRLGIKKKSAAGKEYPAEVPYFVCPSEVQKIYGGQPTTLDVMLPVENEEIFFQQAYKWYSASHLKCKGNGEIAMRRAADLSPEQTAEMGTEIPKDKNEMVEIPCPCPLLDAGSCKQIGNLMVLLPKVSMGGVYQIDSGSINNIIRINSGIAYVRALIGRVALVPLLLKRMPESLEHDGKRQTHYLLSLEFAGNINAVNALRQNSQMVIETVSRIALPAPVESGPDAAPGAVVEQEEDQPSADNHPEMSTVTIAESRKVSEDACEIADTEGCVYKSDVLIGREAFKMKGKQAVIEHTLRDGTQWIIGISAVSVKAA